MRKLKCFFLMLVLSFSLLSSSVVFAAETETSVRPIYSYNKIRLDALSEEEKNTIINLVNSDAPYLAFFRTSSLFPNRYLEAFFFFYPERFDGEWKENGMSVRNFILTRYFFGGSSVSPSFFDYSSSPGGSFSRVIDLTFNGDTIRYPFYLSTNCGIEIPDFSLTLSDGTHVDSSLIHQDIPYGVELRLENDELFFYVPPYGENIPSITSVTVDSLPALSSYISGDLLDISDIELSIHRDDNTVEKVPFADFSVRGVSVSPANGSVLDTSVTSVSVSYEGFTDSFPITVIPPSVSGISVASPPTKTQYYYGESLNLSGASLSVSFDNGAEETISFPDFAAKGVTADPEHGSALTEEIDSVVIAYKEQETLIPITVSPVKDSGVILTNIEENIRSLRDSVSLVVYGILPVAVAILAIFIFLRWFTRTFIHSVIH